MVEPPPKEPPATVVESEVLPPPGKRGGPTPDQIGNLFHQLNEGMTVLRGLRDYIKWDREKTIQEAVARRKHSFRVQLVLMGFLGAIVLAMSVLVYLNKVSGDALLFLVGTVASWILFTVQRHLFESEPKAEESSGFLGGLFK